MARNQYHVSPIGSQWKVTLQGATLGTYLTKQRAVDEGVSVARRNAPSQLIIHRSDGTIEDERTYENDPYPPPG